MGKGKGFGGQWTINKLDCLEKYLKAYIKIFTKNIKAQYFHTIYFDAFAGKGYIECKDPKLQELLPFDNDSQSYLRGSVVRALEINPGFDSYIFVDCNQDCIDELENIKAEYSSEKEIVIVKKDANMYIKEFCKNTNWSKNRCVMFLDPFGMAIDWETIEIIASTKAIDLWLLIPFGSAIIRLLQTKKIPSGAVADRLSEFFGNMDWKEKFYKTKNMQTLFGDEEVSYRNARIDDIKDYIIERLEEIFEKVAKPPAVLSNSKNNPIFLLCVAASNPKGATTSINIAQDILRKING